MARQASIGGTGTQVMLRVCAVMCWVTVLAVTIMVFTVGMPWWAGVLVEVVMLLIILPLGFAVWDDAGQHRDDTERLLCAGRPAVAEVVGLEMS